jgi:hypothetical protein
LILASQSNAVFEDGKFDRMRQVANWPNGRLKNARQSQLSVIPAGITPRESFVEWIKESEETDCAHYASGMSKSCGNLRRMC